MSRQTSESFRLSALLSLSGGLQDAYTYNMRDGVFANAQTGNVVLMSQNFMQGSFVQGLHYMCPLLSFALGIFVAERIENRFKTIDKIHWRQIILIIEIIVLIIVGFMPAEMNMIANMIVSFSCAMQVQTFRKVHGYGYASTMCIGNLRSGTESFSKYLRSRDKTDIVDAHGSQVAHIESKVFSLHERHFITMASGEKFEMSNELLHLIKDITNIEGLGWQLRGNIAGLNFELYDRDESIIAVIGQKAISLHDKFCIDIYRPEYEKTVVAILVTLIHMMKDRESSVSFSSSSSGSSGNG